MLEYCNEAVIINYWNQRFIKSRGSFSKYFNSSGIANGFIVLVKNWKNGYTCRCNIVYYLYLSIAKETK